MLSKIIKQFKENIDGLRDFVALVEPFLQEKEKEMYKTEKENLLPLIIGLSEIENEIQITPEIREKIENKVGKITTNVEENDKGKSVNISFEKQDKDFNKALLKMMKTNYQKELLYKSSLISLTSTAEWFIYQLFHQYYNLYPFPLEHKDKFFSLDDLKEFTTIEDAKNFLISTKVDKIMRQGFEEWYESLKKQEVFGLKLKQVEKYKNDLTEIFQRRHLLVHNGGIANEFYLQKVAAEKTKGVKKGENIFLSKEYIESAIDTIEFCFLLISFELWQKIDKDNIEKRCDVINDFILDYIENEKYKNAENLANFYCAEKGLKEHFTLVGQLNYWQSIKWQGRFNDIKQEVMQADYSAKEALFKAGYYAICDNKDLFFINLDEALKNKKLKIEDAKTWPIFKEMRKEKEFEELITKYS